MKKRYLITTQAEVRAEFWASHPRLKRIPGWKQNQYHVDTRISFIDFVEHLTREGKISEALAHRVTL